MTFDNIDRFHFNLFTKIIIENANQIFTGKSDGIMTREKEYIHIYTLHIHVCLCLCLSVSFSFSFSLCLSLSPSLYVYVCVCVGLCLRVWFLYVCMRACVVQSEKSDKQRFDLDGAALPQTASKRNFA